MQRPKESKHSFQKLPGSLASLATIHSIKPLNPNVAAGPCSCVRTLTLPRSGARTKVNAKAPVTDKATAGFVAMPSCEMFSEAHTSMLERESGLHPNSNGLQPNSEGLQPNSEGLQPTVVEMADEG